jgi:hypothetical protein
MHYLRLSRVHHGKNALDALLRKTVGEPTNQPTATDLGTEDQLPKLSVLTPLQRRAMFSKGPAQPPK